MRVLVPLLFVAAPCLAEDDLSADMTVFRSIDAGVLCAAEATGREPAPGTRLGFIDLVEGEITLGLRTRRIPALSGLAFGVVAELAEGTDAADVRIIVTHPAMGSDGTVRETWQTDFQGAGTTANFFRFDYPEEQVPGEWTMQALRDGKPLYTARFEVVEPSRMPGFQDPCRGPVPVS